MYEAQNRMLWPLLKNYSDGNLFPFPPVAATPAPQQGIPTLPSDSPKEPTSAEPEASDGLLTEASLAGPPESSSHDVPEEPVLLKSFFQDVFLFEFELEGLILILSGQCVD